MAGTAPEPAGPAFPRTRAAMLPLPHRRPARAAVPVIAVAAALVAGAVVGYVGRPLVSPPPVGSAKGGQPAAASGSAGLTVAALARLEPLGGVVPVYGPPGDRVGKLADGLVVGKRLEAGDPIAELASHAERSTEVAVAELTFAEAKRLQAAAEAAGRANLAAAEAEAAAATADEDDDTKALKLQIAVLEKQAAFAASQTARLQSLSAQGVRVPAEEREQAALLAAKADAELEAARIKLRKAEDGFARGRDLAKLKLSAARAELTEAAAKAPIESASKKLDLARQLLALTTLKAPVPGTVLKIASRTGEPTGAQQPVVFLADTTHMVALAEVYEADVPRLRDALAKGQTFTATVTSSAFPAGTTLTGTLRTESQLSRMIARNAVFALSPREDTDRRVIEATVELDEKSSQVAADYVGLQVSVTLTPAAAPAPAGGGK